jgi:hypothetical protein
MAVMNQRKRAERERYLRFSGGKGNNCAMYYGLVDPTLVGKGEKKSPSRTYKQIGERKQITAGDDPHGMRDGIKIKDQGGKKLQ